MYEYLFYEHAENCILYGRVKGKTAGHRKAHPLRMG
jgi:hypothetical protein